MPDAVEPTLPSVGGQVTQSTTLDSPSVPPKQSDAPDAPGSPDGAGQTDGSPPGAQPPVRAKPRHFPCFDGLRAIAATAILLDHAAWASGYTLQNPSIGAYFSRFDVAVSIFFAVSGFLLYRPFVASQMTGRPRPSATKFWIRRILRIVPAYWFALTILTYGFHVITVGRGWQGVVADYSFMQIYFPSQSFTGITQAWTLCTEMSFYLFLPFYAMVMAYHRRSSKRPHSPERQLRRELIGVVVLIVGSNLWRWWALNLPFLKTLPNGKTVGACYPHCATQPLFQSLYTNWLMSYLDTFGLGMLLAVLSAWITLRGPDPGWLRHRLMPYISWGIAGVLFVVSTRLHITLGPLYFASPIANIARQALEGLVAFFMLVPAVFGPQDRSVVRKFLTSWPVASIGLVSYGMYLWHLNMITLFMDWTGFVDLHVPFWQLALPALGLAIAWGTVSYFVVERPVLRYKDRIGWWGSARSTRQAAAAPKPVAVDTNSVAP